MAADMNTLKNSFIYSVKRTIPILIGFFPVGIAYGVLMNEAGYNAAWTGFTSLTVFAGSLQMLMISFFTSDVSVLTVAVAAALLNSRHIFYGISFIDKFNAFKPWKGFLIFALPDETYTLHCAYKPEKDTDEKYVYVFTALLVYFYWFVCSIAGSLVGSLITFDTTGIDFAMTALFIVILLDRIKDADTLLPAYISIPVSVALLAVLGPDSFLLPSLIVTVLALILVRPRIESGSKEGME